jgi:magnesium and cobalt exporter, CNNM family
MTTPILLVVAIFLCLLGNGFFSGSEIAILSIRRSRVEQLIAEGSRGARWVKHLQDNMDRFLATVQIGVTLMGTLAGVIGGYLASRYLEPLFHSSGLAGWIPSGVEATFVVGAMIVYVELILGELVPKALALRFTDTVAVIVAWPLDMMARFSRAMIAFITASTRAVLYLFRIRDPGHRTFVSEEEIKHLVKEGREQGVLDQTEEELIHSVFEFSETPVKKVMVPRPKIFALDVNTPPEEVSRMMVESGFSRVPVYDASPDNMVGVVYIKDALRLMEKRQPVVLRKIVHPVHFVPETKKVGELLKELQKRRTHIALVIDEHGSLVGLVTLEDVLEEIVGEIQDEYDWEERPVEKLRDGSLVVDGTVSAADLRQNYEVPIPDSEDFATVAGFMLDCLGAVPRGGEVVQVGDWRLTVVDVEKNRISKVKIDRVPAAVKV